MRVSGTFKVSDFTPTQVSSPQIQTAVAVGATMDKKYEGEVIGRSTTLFTSAFNESTALGTYLAMESSTGRSQPGRLLQLRALQNHFGREPAGRALRHRSGQRNELAGIHSNRPNRPLGGPVGP
ncbi:DUF3224 domain-containing protein [Streptomyces sp. NPDC057298]|uniref:DUF3224 domain-containing protein n=1 Tax=Streptomyces sp. NPDC057298 TaxID=3346091 RepID=UPI003640FF66